MKALLGGHCGGGGEREREWAVDLADGSILRSTTPGSSLSRGVAQSSGTTVHSEYIHTFHDAGILCLVFDCPRY